MVSRVRAAEMPAPTGGPDTLDGLTKYRRTMIKLTRLGGEPFVLNADLIRYVEQRPDTFITLVSGETIVVGESMDEVLRRAVVYQQAKHMLPRFEKPVPFSDPKDN